MLYIVEETSILVQCWWSWFFTPCTQGV